MIAESVLSSKFQLTLPKAVAKHLGAQPSDRIIYQCEGSKVFLRVKNLSIKGAIARFPRRGQPAISLEEMQKAIELGRAS